MSTTDSPDRTETATVAGGCFWCTEAVFEEINGVVDVTSGYAGGHVADPSYEAVCSGETGHAECVQVEYDPDRLSYEDVLTVHFATHDPTTEDREGPDVGSQYRSAVFYHDEDQRETVERFVVELDEEYDDDVVSEIGPLETFYPAEAHHQNYFEKNPQQAYCRANVAPKVEKVRERFRELTAA